MLKFYKSRSMFIVKVTCSTYMLNMQVLSLTKIMGNFFFQKLVKGNGKGHMFKIYGTFGKILL